MHAALFAAVLCQVAVPTGLEEERPDLTADYVDLDLLARRYRVTWTSDAATGREVLKTGKTTIVVAPSLAIALVDGIPQKLPRPVILSDGRVRVPSEVARMIDGTAEIRKDPVVKDPVRPKTQKIRKWFTIVLDPGHGGMHTGCRGRRGSYEKDLVLDISMRLRPLLEALGGEVVMTRVDDRHFDTNVHRDLQHRVDVVNRTRPDLFLSVHVNYVASSGPRGFEVWVRRSDRASRELASYVRGEMNRALCTEDRGIKDDRALYVLRNTMCPAALVEVGFISHPAEEGELCDPAHRQKLAVVLSEAVRKYLEARR